MKTRFCHVNGKYDLETGSPLCEVYCTPDGESFQYLFENGWLPQGDGQWYQARSSRAKITPISGNRRRKIKKLNISTTGDYKGILDKVEHLYPGVVRDEVERALSLPHEIYYFNDTVFSIMNWYDNIPYVPVLLGGRLDRSGITPQVHFFFIQQLVGKTDYPYVYVSEWYEQFKYKSELPNFEWWNGESWARPDLQM